MFNVNELTSRLAGMSDQQLLKYAQLHKADPYTLALASSESKRRSQIRAAGQQQAGQQPTVADQAISQMGAPAPMPQQAQLPEQQGIGMLPAQNMAGMADGGIAGYGDSYADEYADGGIVAFAGEGPSLVGQGFRQDQILPAPRVSNVFANRMAEESAQDVVAEIAKMENIITTTPPGPQRQFAEQRLAQLRNKAPAPALEQFVAPPPVERKPGYAVEGKKKGENANYPAPIDEGNVYTGRDTANPFNTKTDAGKNAAAKRPGAGITKDGKAGPVATAPDFVPSKPGDLTTELARLQKMSPGTKAYDDLNAKIKRGYADLEKAREEGKPKDKAYAGLEALLGKEEEKAKGKEARNFNMALINAGLAIAGGRSQYALQNIAEGAQVGTKQYQEGLEKLEAAALERRKQSAMIEEARRAEVRGDFKEAQAFKQKAFEAGLGVEQAKIAAIQDLYKVDLKTATDIKTNQDTLASADQRALMQQVEETKRAREKNINDRLVAGTYASARAADRGAITPALMLKEYNDLLGANPLAKKQYPTFESYMAAIQRASQGGKDPYAGWGNLQVGPGKQ
jgi:hypothetical protein